MCKARDALFFKGSRAFFLHRDQLLTQFFLFSFQALFLLQPSLVFLLQLIYKIALTVYTLVVYTDSMIRNFADRETEKVYNQTFSKKLPQNIQSVALRKLIMIDNAGCLEDLHVPPANRLEKLDGDRKGQYSIRINDQYRICFQVEGNNFFDVEIVDYH